MLGELSDTIGAIYDCAFDPGLWPSTLAMLRRHMDFANASLDVLEMPTGTVLLNVLSGVDEAWARRTAEYGSDVIEQWGGAERIRGFPLDEPVIMSVVNPQGLTRANRYYAEWVEPQGIIDVMAVGLARDAATIGSVGFGRHRDAGPIGDPEVALTRLFIPHLKRSVAISRLLEVKTVRAATFETVFDALAVGVLLVAADMRLVHANRAGEAALAAGDPLRLRAGTVAASHGVGAALAVAVDRAARDADGIGRQGLGVPARGRDGADLVLHVMPLRPDSRSGTILPSAVAAIFLAPAVAPRPAPIAAIAALFDLTPGEARVLEQVAAGRTNAETAQALGIQLSTVRTHLLHLFDKTRTHRQSDLAALVSSFSLPLG